MTLSHVWALNDWNNEAFNWFCDKLYRELGQLVLGCGFVLKGPIFFKTIVGHVSHNRQQIISEMGYKFGATQDDDGNYSS